MASIELAPTDIISYELRKIHSSLNVDYAIPVFKVALSPSLGDRVYSTYRLDLTSICNPFQASCIKGVIARTSTYVTPTRTLLNTGDSLTLGTNTQLKMTLASGVLVNFDINGESQGVNIAYSTSVRRTIAMSSIAILSFENGLYGLACMSCDFTYTNEAIELSMNDGEVGYMVATFDEGYKVSIIFTAIPNINVIDAVGLFYEETVPFIADTDPYSPGGETGEGGGEGTFDDTSEPIPTPDIPATSVIQTGFISLYSPDITQLRSLASYLWSDTGLDLDTFKRIFSDPISAILGLSLIPLQPSIGNVENVVLGNVSTSVSMPRLTSQYIKYSCGSLTIEEYWGGYLDYSPYTRAEIYLPFIGAKPLNVDDIMGKTLSLSYLIDVLSGGCVACLEAGGSVLYQFIGQCACSVPITGRDLTNVINGVLSVVGAGAGVMLATGGLGLAGLAAAGSLASNVTGMKPHVEKSGSMGGMGGMLGVKTPYIILTRPRQAVPANQNIFTGYPSYITMMLGEATGYTVVYDVHLEGIHATDEEKAEIDRLLKEGVIL